MDFTQLSSNLNRLQEELNKLGVSFSQVGEDVSGLDNPEEPTLEHIIYYRLTWVDLTGTVRHSAVATSLDRLESAFAALKRGNKTYQIEMRHVFRSDWKVTEDE